VSDRALQDDIIRALADASYRTSVEWRAKRLADLERVERFARFLARHFYYERVIHFFKYSRALARVTGRKPEDVLSSAGFDALLPIIVMGSRPSARDVTRLVVEYVEGAPGARRIRYLNDLLRYEQAMMVVEAGPRDWSEPPGEVQAADEATVAELVEGTEVVELHHDLPTILDEMLRPWDEPPMAVPTEMKLLVARSRHGRVAVAHAPEGTTRLLDLARGGRTVDELVHGGDLEEAATRRLLGSLVELGALRFSTGS
jgi:hypothetical protein